MFSWIAQIGASIAVFATLVVGIFTGSPQQPAETLHEATFPIETGTIVKEAEKSAPNDDPASSEINAFADSDGDGLKNWQEDLWKTSKNTPDTDKDGTSDGQEVAQNRNPNKTPPDSVSVGKPTNTTIATKPTNTAQPRQNTPKPTTPPPTLGSVPVPQNEPEPPPVIQKSPLREYGNNLADALKDNDAVNKALEQSVFAHITGTGALTAADFDGLSKISSNYQALAKNIALISAPNEAKSSQNGLISSFKTLSVELEKLASYKSSLKIPPTAFKAYNTAAISVSVTLFDTAKVFKENGVIFSVNESGSIFNLPEK